MSAALIAAALAGVSGLAQAGIGIADRVKSNKLRKQSLADWKKESGIGDYETPQSYIDYFGLSETMARQEMPGLQAMKGDVAQSTAQALGGAQNLDAGSSAAVLLGAQQNRLSALRQLGIAASQYQAGQQENYRQAIGQGAQYEQQAYEYNQWLPGQMRLGEIQAYRGAGNQGIVSGLDTMGAAGIQYANMNAMNQWYNNMNPQASPYSTGSPGPYVPFQNQSINQLGQQQVQPATNLGSDPYSGKTYNPSWLD